MSKYRAIRTEYNGTMYASKAEAAYAAKLDLLIRAGEVRFYLEQVKFKLPGKVKYLLDFQVIKTNGEIEWIDVKGFMTPISKLKIKQVEEIYKINITLTR